MRSGPCCSSRTCAPIRTCLAWAQARFRRSFQSALKILRPGTSGRFEWLIHVNRSRKPAGWVSLRIADRDLASGEIGYSLVRDFRGCGIASEAAALLLREAFEQAALSRVNAYCVPENAASRRLLERLQFE